MIDKDRIFIQGGQAPNWVRQETQRQMISRARRADPRSSRPESGESRFSESTKPRAPAT